MKIIFRNIGLILFLVSPLFSALLTQDLEVISPTGMPLNYVAHELEIFTASPNHSITIRFIETSNGVFLVREHTKGGVIHVSLPTDIPKTSHVIFKYSSGNIPEGRVKKMNVTLE